MMRAKRWFVVPLAILTLTLIVAGCSTPEPMATEAPTATPAAMDAPTDTAEPTEEPTATEAMEATEAPEDEEEMEPTPTPEAESEAMGAAWAADGTISDGEYAQEADFDGIRLWWMNDDTHLYLAMEGDTTGWVAVGLNPELGMKGANYIFGFVADGEAQLWDAWGMERTGANHPPDSDLGGSNDIVDFAGVEEDGVTRFEAKIPLDSGDEYDNALEPGESYPVIVAIGDRDEFNAYHLKYASGEIALSAP
jgi:hypothetical protein